LVSLDCTFVLNEFQCEKQVNSTESGLLPLRHRIMGVRSVWDPIVIGVLSLITFHTVSIVYFVFVPLNAHQTIFGLANYLLVLVGVFIIYKSYLLSVYRIPGFSPKEFKPEVPQADLDEAVLDARQAKKREHDVLVRYCVKCEAFKAPRSHHCKECNRCVLKMDHHCPWVNNCVGHSNHKVFMIFLSSASSMLIYASVWFGYNCYHLFMTMPTQGGRRPIGMKKGPVKQADVDPLWMFHLLMSFINCILALAVGIAIAALLVDQVQQVWNGVTGIEWYTRKSRIKAAKKK